MATNVDELISRIMQVLEENQGSLGIGEFLNLIRQHVVSPRMLIEALERLEGMQKIEVTEDKRIRQRRSVVHAAA